MVLACLVLGCILVISFPTEGRQHWDRRFCKDELPYESCNFYSKMGACKYPGYKRQMAKLCPKFCDLCTYGLEASIDDCKDKDNVLDCKYLKEIGACENYADIMQERCASTCKMCDATIKCRKKQCKYNEVCQLDENRDAQCVCPDYCPDRKRYEALGKVCGSDGKTYTNYCKLREQRCKENNNITVTKYGICDTDIPCEDSKLEKESGLCDVWEKNGYCSKADTGETMEKYCKRTCGFCDRKAAFQRLRGDCDDPTLSPFGCCWDLSFRPDPKSGKKCPECKDYRSLCPRFLEQCNKPTNANFMSRNCAASCGFCVPEKKPILQLKVLTNSGRSSYTIQRHDKRV